MINRLAIVGALGVLASLSSVAPAAAQGTIPCARENGTCVLPYRTTVIYGSQGATTSREAGPGGIPCNNRVFGDPAPGLGKHCSYVAREGRYEERRRDYDRRDRDYDRRRY